MKLSLSVVATCLLCGIQSAAANVVEVGLGSSSNPLPQVAAAVARQETAREQAEDRKLRALQAAFAQIQSSASAHIVGLISRSRGKASFLGLNPVEPAVRVTVVGAAADESAGAHGISNIEAKRQAAEDQLLDGAVSELNELAKVIIQTVEQSLGGRRSFLQTGLSATGAEGYHRQLNVRLTGDSSYPTVSSMAAAMERRRDVSESRIRAIILDLQLKLAKRLNAVIASAARA